MTTPYGDDLVPQVRGRIIARIDRIWPSPDPERQERLSALVMPLLVIQREGDDALTIYQYDGWEVPVDLAGALGQVAYDGLLRFAAVLNDPDDYPEVI